MVESYYTWFGVQIVTAILLKVYQIRLTQKEEALAASIASSNEEASQPLTQLQDENETDSGITGSANQRLKLLAFKNFQRSYVLIFLMVMLADWMQGPYVYKLYSSYELKQPDIASLFVVGFGTSGVFGIFIGGLADKFGRKLTCLIFCLTYSLGCLTKHYHNYNILLIGRFCGGVSTSILFSAFESWMVTHHNKKNYPINKLGDTFSLAWSLNSVIAVLAGIITSYAVSFYRFYQIVNGPPNAPYEVAAFDCSAIVLIFAFIGIISLWDENYGNSNINVIGNIKKSFNLLQNDARILFTGLIQTGFESAMYIFVFMWTPALESTHINIETDEIDHGMIFADFMVACLIGTLSSSIISKLFKWNTEQIGLLLCVIACIFMFIVPNTSSYEIRFFCFLIFEMCVGMYFPTIGTLRSKYIPDEVRATVMNIFRIPFNIIVVIILLYVNNLGLYTTFSICSALLGIAVFGTYLLSKTPAVNSGIKTNTNAGH